MIYIVDGDQILTCKNILLCWGKIENILCIVLW